MPDGTVPLIQSNFDTGTGTIIVQSLSTGTGGGTLPWPQVQIFQNLTSSLVGTCVTSNEWAQVQTQIWQHWNTAWNQTQTNAWTSASTCGSVHHTPLIVTNMMETWASWNQRAWGVPALIPKRTPEEERLFQAQQAEARRAAAEKAEHEKKLRAEAKQKARVLLQENLTDAQWACFQKNGFFYQEINGRRYKINLGRSGNVYEVDKNDKPLTRFCIHPVENVPDEDTVLAQKLWLMTDEADFRRIANQTRMN